MFTIKQPDSFALLRAETINRIGADMLASLSKSTIAAFRELYYDGEELRPKEDIQRILNAFERPADLFDRHLATITFLLGQDPDIMQPGDYTPPVPYIINADGTVTLT